MIQIPLGQQGIATIEKPTRGMTKAQVDQRYGNPIDKTTAVGSPPISSWIYPEFTVYFEYDMSFILWLNTQQKCEPVNDKGKQYE